MIVDLGPCECCGKFTPCEICNGVFPSPINIAIRNATGVFDQLNNTDLRVGTPGFDNGFWHIDYTTPLPKPRNEVQYSWQNRIYTYLRCCSKNHLLTLCGFADTPDHQGNYVYGEIDRWMYIYDPANGFDGAQNYFFTAYTFSCPPLNQVVNVNQNSQPVTVYELDCDPFYQDMHIHVDAIVPPFNPMSAGDMDWIITE